MPGKNPLAAVGSVRNFMNIVKEVNFDEIRERAETAPRILMIARTQEHAETAAELIFGNESDRYIEHRVGDRVERIDTARYDVVVVTDPDQTGLFDQAKTRAARDGVDNLFFLASDGPDAANRLRTEIVMTDPESAPAMGRWFVPFRAAAVHAIIDGASKANAKFALVSNIPSVVPLFGGFIAAGADLLVLTKNQIMMAYKLAAANDRDLSNQAGIVRELAPVVGVGFVWRSVAREATSFIPFMAGTIPKVAIAFAGTYTVGLAVDSYYRFGKKPTGEQMKAFREQAVKLAASIPLPGRAKAEAAEDAIEAGLRQSVEAGETQRSR
ncbi:hypothetical protein BH24CHL3_BH24CHL3_08460 [soil metagenome]